MKIRDLFVPTKTNKFKAVLLRSESIALITVFVFVANLLLPNFYLGEVSAEVDLNSLVYAHNKERGKFNLDPLVLNSKLIESATNKAEAMIESDCWDHYCPIPPGVSPWRWFDESGYKYETAGENLAEGFSENDILVDAWMNSPTHKENILKPSFREMGIGFAYGDYQNIKNNTVVVVHFGSEQASPIVENIQIERIFDKEDDFVINYPSSGSIISPLNFRIEGFVTKPVFRIELWTNEKLINEIEMQGENFVFKDIPTSLTEGENILSVKGFDEEGELVGESEEVNVYVDSYAPVIDINTLKMDEVLNDSGYTYLILKLPSSSEIVKTWIDTEVGKIGGIKTADDISYKVELNEISGIETIYFVFSDSAGNTSKYAYSVQKILSEIPPKFLDNNVEIEASENFSVFSMGVLPDMNLKSLTNILILLAIGILIIIDYLVIKKLDDNLVGTNGRHHLKLALILVIGFILVLSAGAGSILTGTNI